MSDPSIAEFNSRLARIETARSKGHGFEAEGALGRSFYTRSDPRYRKRLRIPVLRPLILALLLGTFVKAVLVHQLGAEAYDGRVNGLLAGQGIDRVGGWLMQSDIVTEALAQQLSRFGRLDG